MERLTPAEILQLRQAAKAKTKIARQSDDAVPELTRYELYFVATIALLAQVGKATAAADVLTEVLDRTGVIGNVQQARNAATKLTAKGLLASHFGHKEPGTPGKPPLAYTVTDLGRAALRAKTAEILELAALLKAATRLDA